MEVLETEGEDLQRWVAPQESTGTISEKTLVSANDPSLFYNKDYFWYAISKVGPGPIAREILRLNTEYDIKRVKRVLHAMSLLSVLPEPTPDQADKFSRSVFYTLRGDMEESFTLAGKRTTMNGILGYLSKKILKAIHPPDVDRCYDLGRLHGTVQSPLTLNSYLSSDIAMGMLTDRLAVLINDAFPEITVEGLPLSERDVPPSTGGIVKP